MAMASFYNRLKLATNTLLNKKSTTASPPQNFFFDGKSSGVSSTLNSSKQYLNAIETISYVGRCVTTITNDISGLEWKIVNDRTGKVVNNSKVAQLLNNPFTGLSYDLWASMICAHMLLDGNAFVIPNAFEKDLSGQIKSLYPVIPSDVDIISTTGRIVSSRDTESFSCISKYQIVADSLASQLEPDKVFQLKINCIKNIIRGMGVVQMNASTLEQDQVANILSKQFFEEGVFSNIIITPPADMHPEQFELWQKLMNSKIKGNQNWFDPLYTLPGGDIKALPLSMKDMEMIDKQRFTKQGIASAFYLPDIIAGIDGSGKYDTAPEQMKSYFEGTIPRFSIPFQRFVTRICKTIEPENSFVLTQKKYVDIAKVSVAINGAFDRGILSQNESRELLGLPRVEGDAQLDNRYMLMSYVPSSSIDNPMQMQAVEPLKEEKSLSCGHNHDTKATDSQLAFHRASKATKQLVQKKMLVFINEYFKEYGKRVLAGLEKNISIEDVKAANIDDIFANSERELMTQSARKMFTSAVSVSATGLNSLLPVAIEKSFSNYKIPLMVEKLAIKYVDVTIDTRREELRAIIRDSIENGDGISTIKERIQDELKTLTSKDGWKAQRIARTESANAYRYVSYESYSEMGAKTVDVIGCIDGVKVGFDCLRTDIPIDQMLTLRYPPNHTGTEVVREIG